MKFVRSFYVVLVMATIALVGFVPSSAQASYNDWSRYIEYIDHEIEEATQGFNDAAAIYYDKSQSYMARHWAYKHMVYYYSRYHYLQKLRRKYEYYVSYDSNDDCDDYDFGPYEDTDASCGHTPDKPKNRNRGQNNGWGNGDQDAPGGSEPNNGAENAGGNRDGNPVAPGNSGTNGNDGTNGRQGT